VLKSVRLRNFKSFREAELPLAPLTVLIGANASGKTNLVEGIHLLSWIAQGNLLSNVGSAMGHRAVRGSVGALGYDGANRFGFGCTIAAGDWDRYDIDVEADDGAELRIADERITRAGSKVALFETVGRVASTGRDLRVAYNNFARGGKKPLVTCHDQMAVLRQLMSAARFEAGHREAQSRIPEICEDFQTELLGVRVFDPQPAAMRGYSHRSEQWLERDGANLSGVVLRVLDERGLDEIREKLNALQQELAVEFPSRKPGKPLASLRHREDERLMLTFVRSLPEQDITAIKFVRTERDEVMVALTESFGGKMRDYDATVLSDGTLRVLAIAAALLSAPRGGLVVIEEVDNGVHPSRAGAILRGMMEVAKARDLRVLVSTHNPALLDAMPEEAVPDVVFCYRDPEAGCSRLVRLADIPDYPALVARDTLGHLLTSGLIDRFAKDTTSPEDRKRKAQAWLRRLYDEAS
jgi:ABC-type branched-subunit amino acid transport system ATPase component